MNFCDYSGNRHFGRLSSDKSSLAQLSLGSSPKLDGDL